MCDTVWHPPTQPPAALQVGPNKEENIKEVNLHRKYLVESLR